MSPTRSRTTAVIFPLVIRICACFVSWALYNSSDRYVFVLISSHVLSESRISTWSYGRTLYHNKIVIPVGCLRSVLCGRNASINYVNASTSVIMLA